MFQVVVYFCWKLFVGIERLGFLCWLKIPVWSWKSCTVTGDNLPAWIPLLSEKLYAPARSQFRRKLNLRTKFLSFSSPTVQIKDESEGRGQPKEIEPKRIDFDYRNRSRRLSLLEAASLFGYSWSNETKPETYSIVKLEKVSLKQILNRACFSPEIRMLTRNVRKRQIHTTLTDVTESRLDIDPDQG